jgi:phosphotransferase system  glucose/maltose/N-acetylglucosamine-specific IIC component
MDLTHIVYAILIAFALLVVAYWVMYTTRLKTPRNVGKNEGIAMATQEKERSGKTGMIG